MDVEAPPVEASRGGVVPPAAGGVDGTVGTGRGGVGVGSTETVGAGTVGGGTGAGTVGVEAVGAGRLGTGTVGTEIVGAGTLGSGTVGTSRAGFAAPTACAATSPRPSKARAASTRRLRTNPNARIHTSNGRTSKRDTPDRSRAASRNRG